MVGAVTREEQGGRKRLKKVRKAPPEVRQPAVDREMERQRTLQQRVQRHAQTLSRALSFERTPEVGEYQVPKKLPRMHMFPSIKQPSPKYLGRHGKKLAFMQKVLHFARRSGAGFGGSHHAPSSGMGILHVDFKRDPDLRNAYQDHLHRHLPKVVANVFRRGSDETTGVTHHVSADHKDLWDAVERHFAGIEEMERSPLLGLLLTSAGW